MIIITQEGFDITIKGHANSAEHGKDLVCASVTVLVYTLAQALKAGKSMLESLETHVDVGDSHIVCEPKEEYVVNVQMIYWTILNGFRSIADNYPDFVIFDEGGLEMGEDTDVS